MFSIGFSQIPNVRDYIVKQEEHHRKISFQDEFRTLLRRYEIDFDERVCVGLIQPFQGCELLRAFPG